MGEALWWSGDYPAARRYLEPVLSPGFGGLRGRALTSLTVFRLAYVSVLVALGFCDQANKRLEEVLSWVQDLGFADPTATAFLIACTSDLHRRSPRSALEHSKMVNEISAARGVPGELAIIMKGWALSCLGQVEEGIDTMRAGIAALESTGVVTPTFGLIPLADGYIRIGRLKESAELVDQMLDRVQRTGHRQDEAEVHRLKGAFLMSGNTPDLAAAEQSFRKAIEVARNQSAKLYELRATTSLALLLRETNRLDEARAMLSEIYNWFTEGFDTADLKDAKALLEELGKSP
jgi:tetratricopeptide (TPR) repeat protein